MRKKIKREKQLQPIRTSVPTYTLKPPLLKSTPVESHVLEGTPVYMKVPSPSPNLRSSGQAISSNEKAPTKKFKTLTLSDKLTRRREVEEILKPFARKFPRGEEENTVIIYTTSDLGRTIYYECEQVRSILQLHHVKIDERMFGHHMYQLREALGKEQFPAVFVKGRFIGGAVELMKLEEEGKLEILLDGIQKLHN
ncbi:hypothetical protein IFM89_029493 [Coptis chinensis]|uniref:Glutaredoxin domain-containing protein n=1 Tax=Coptis chinensis TaxID=261450 RepID=A0A835LXK9_9MAGN|nr:hypothetical protein IFM89_029493 [Coptis chinensis]